MSVYGIGVADLVMALLVLGGSLALGRHALRITRDKPSARGRATALIAGLVALHIMCAVLMWFTLFPPQTRIAAETLVVLAARAELAPAPAGASRIVALPEAGTQAGAERVADLATALRKFPDTRRIRVIGDGLTTRDLDAARDVVVEFLPAAMPAVLVELSAPLQVAQGARWQLHGRVAGAGPAMVQLRDPSGNVASRAPVGEDGRFTLETITGVPGIADYSLRVLRDGQPAQRDIPLPLQVTSGDRLRLLLLAGAPGPELKYLRRWAVDAGLDARSEIALGAGNEIRTASAASGERRFEGVDLVILDERAWRTLGGAGEAALLHAARAGAGVLLRVTSSLTADDRARLRQWGFHDAVVQPQGTAAQHTAASPRANRRALHSALQTRPSGIAASDGIALRDPGSGTLLGLYRNEGRGRLGVWWAVDTYRGVLAGGASEHGALWSHAVAELARPRGGSDSPRWMAASMRVAERQTVCGFDSNATVVGPDGQVTALVSIPEPAGSAERYCAGFWPRTPGWHALRIGAASWPFHVRSVEDAPGLRTNANREATLQLAALPAPVVESLATSRPGARWPWFLAWLAASALLWWLERASTRRAGMN